MDGILWAFLIAVVLGFAGAAGALAYFYLQGPARKLLVALVAAEAVLAALHILFARHTGTFSGWLFNLNSELTAGALFSAAQLTVIALFALVIAVRTPSLGLGQRLYWVALVALFAWLASDEFFALHETVPTWRSMYALLGLSVVGLSLAAFRLGFRGEAGLFVPLLAGFLIMGGAGVVLDALTNDHDLVVAGYTVEWVNFLSCDAAWMPVACTDVNEFGFTEEFLEMAGASLMLASLFNFFQKRQAASQVRLLRRLIAVTGTTWLLLWVSSFWVVPAVAAAMRSEPVHVEYLDGRLSLVGYHVSKPVLLPGDTVTVSLYFRADQPLPEDYLLAVKLFTRYEDETLAEADAQLGEWKYPTSAWIPGVTVRHQARLTIPRGAATPRSYWLTARVWHEDEEVHVEETTLEESGTGTVVLCGLPLLSRGAPPDAPTPAAYSFAGGPILAGYDLPAQAAPGSTVELAFWWRTEAAVPVELNQFVHFLQQGGEGIFTYDQAPFGGENFPTVYWPAGIHEMARWRVDLPPTLPPGVYDVYTGLYTLPDVQRQPVFDERGEPVLDGAILMGQIVIEGE